MKTTEKNRESFIDILFTGRNKEYGAYEIRKKYEKYLILAFILSTSALMIGISVPLIASYYGNHRIKPIIDDFTATFDPLRPPPPETPPPPPPIEDKILEKQTAFLKPIVTIDTANIDDNFGRQDILNTYPTTGIIDTLDFSRDTTTAPPVIESPKTAEIYTVVEEMPQFIGGEEERLRFLHENMHYPTLAKELGIFGTVYIEFVVEESGSITSVIVKKGIGGGCDEEASRVVKLMRYLPGRQAGKPVSVRFTIPIKFMLSNQ